jgi:hypothetical protein
MTPKLDPRQAPPTPNAPQKPVLEQRRHPRVAVPARCWIVDGEHTVYLRVHDVSLGGLSVRAPVPFRPSGNIEVRLELPSGVTVRAKGEVVWVRPEGGEVSGQPRMGARFLEFLEGEEELYTLLGHG